MKTFAVDKGEAMISVHGSGQACSATWRGESPSERGTVDLDTIDGTEWWVARALVQGPRSQGIGSNLLQAALEKAVSMGAKTVLVVPGGYGESPKKQRRFYEKNGFRKVRREGMFVWIWSPN